MTVRVRERHSCGGGGDGNSDCGGCGKGLGRERRDSEL